LTGYVPRWPRNLTDLTGISTLKANSQVRRIGRGARATLEIDDDHEDQESCQQVHHIREILSIKGLLQSPRLVTPSKQQMEETNDCALEFRTTPGINSCWGKSLPDDILTDIGRNKERNARSNSVSLLKHFIEENDNHARSAELKNQKNDDPPPEIRRTAVDARGNVHDSLPERQNQCKHYIC